MSRMLLGSASLDELLDRITDELKRLVPYDVLTVYRVDPVRSLLVPLHSCTPPRSSTRPCRWARA
jgi:hypothetical protein